MGFSSLVTGVTLSPFKSSRNNTTIDSVAIHTMASNGTAEGCGYWFTDERAQASSNYGIDGSGIIWGYVDESERAWCTSNGGVDRRAITIEVASTTSEEPFACTQEAYDSLINLLVDICQRYGLTLKWKNDKEYAVKASEGGPVTDQNMFVHRWFNTVKSCPGQYLFEKHYQIASDVNSRLEIKPAVTSPTTSVSSAPTSSTTTSATSAPNKQPTTSVQLTTSVPDTQGTSKSAPSSSSITDSSSFTKINVGERKIAFVGDSRMLEMKSVLNQNFHMWSCSDSASYTWLTTKGVPDIESKLTSGYSVCITISPTEAFNAVASSYSDYINKCAARWKEKDIFTYFISMNPVGTKDSGSYNNITNYMICEYNQKIRNGLSSNVGYIDTYSALINNYNTIDGFHYSKELTAALYHLIDGAVNSDDPSLYDNPAVMGGTIVQVDYTQLNPYVVTLDRNSPDTFQYDALKPEGVVGVIIEGGFLYDSIHTKVKFRQPKFKQQLESVKRCNLDYGFFFTIRSRNLSEASSEMNEIRFLLRSNPCKLGVWLKLEFSTNQVDINNSIIDYFQKQLILLGFISKIGFYVERKDLNTFTWSKYSSMWLLWVIDHVQDESDIKRVLDSSFFNVVGGS